jgi:hypothetical protein
VASRGMWAGWVAFAGMLMLILGGLDMLQGLTAIIRDQYYYSGNNGSLVIDVSQWGWIMLIWGAILAFIGWGLLSGASWARWLAIFGIGLNFLAVLSFNGGYDFTLWSLLAVALNVLVLWALIVRWDDAKAGMAGA